jgi:hypothetical protein
MMEAVSASETSVGFYQTARRNIPEYIQRYTCRYENLKYHLLTGYETVLRGRQSVL